MNDIKHYQLKSSHLYQEEDIIEKQLFERNFTVKELRKYEATFYDPNLKVHFFDENKSGYLVEIVLNNFQLHVCRRMKQAEDFLRRINYLFDFVHLKINKNGKILSIENIEELQQEWNKLKSFLLSDYSGIEVDDYLKEIDTWFETGKEMENQMFSLFHYGMAFPSIPMKHTDNWESHCPIRLSEYEPEGFEQQISYIKKEGNSRFYSISGKSRQESNIEIVKYEGKIIANTDTLFPEHAKIEVDFLYQSGNYR